MKNLKKNYLKKIPIGYQPNQHADINMGRKANRFITKIVNYAGSKAEDSSAYVKVYE